jgi:hypothetical protein
METGREKDPGGIQPISSIRFAPRTGVPNMTRPPTGPRMVGPRAVTPRSVYRRQGKRG